MPLYDMGRRITELVLRRETALGILAKGPRNSYVSEAIDVLSDEPEPGTPGGPSRYASDVQSPHKDKGGLVEDNTQTMAAVARNVLEPSALDPVLLTAHDLHLAKRRQQRKNRVSKLPRQRRPNTHRTAQGPLHSGMSPAEFNVAHLVAEGLSNNAIGEELKLSPDTVKTHVSRMLFKLRLRNRAALAVFTAEVESHDKDAKPE